MSVYITSVRVGVTGLRLSGDRDQEPWHVNPCDRGSKQWQCEECENSIVAS